MKKVLLLSIIAFSFASCNKCQDCTCGTVTEEVCKEDFDSNEEYTDGIETLEALGCDCN